MLVDTSVWVDHLRRPNRRLSEKLDADIVWTHLFVIGELACGNLSPRHEILHMLGVLRSVPTVEHDQVLRFVDERRLNALGLGWIDMHLLASAYAAQVPIWTLDSRLAGVAEDLDLAVRPD